MDYVHLALLAAKLVIFVAAGFAFLEPARGIAFGLAVWCLADMFLVWFDGPEPKE